MQTSRSKYWKYGLTAAGAILVGALGSGLWEAILRPALRRISFWLLDAASVGFESYRTGVYREIAQGVSKTEFDAFVTITAVFGGFTLVIMFANLFVTSLARRFERRSVESESDSRATRTDSPTSKTFIGAQRVVTHRATSYILIASLALILAQQLVLLARDGYSSRAIVHYEQLLRIASPYLDANHRAIIESKFAQIDSKENYVQVTTELEQVAKANGQKVPTFSPW